MPISGCRTPSSGVCKKTLKRRSDSISKLRDITSGGDSTIQLRAEIQSLTKDQWEELLAKANLPVVIPTDHALAMKADLSISWSKLRVIRR